MSERICDNCGNKKKVSYGKICEKHHFICQACGADWRDTCPVCGKKIMR